MKCTPIIFLLLLLLLNAVLSYNEPVLLEQMKAGSEAAFTQLYEHYSLQMYYNILKIIKDPLTAEELVQDVFSSLWQKRESINIDTNFGGYLFFMGRNRVMNFFSRLERDHKLYQQIKATATEGYQHVEEALLSKENASSLQKAIESLPPGRRRVFELIKINGLTYKQASEQLGISMSTVRSQMEEARQGIRSFINDNNDAALTIMVFLAFYQK